jgi:hypothetical protein
MGGACYVNVMH